MLTQLPRAALAAVPLFLVACGGASSNGEQQPAGETGASAENAAAETQARPQTGAAAEMFLGDPDAPVTVIEYASVTCPHCATFHETIFPAIKEKYVDAGKVKFIFREFPTAPAGLSYVGSVLARCAADKGGRDAYFLVLGALFKTQRTWIYGEDPKAELLKIAAQAGMDEASFDACMQRQELVELINANVDEASSKYQINSTPSFVIDGEKQNVRTVEEFEKALDAALAESQG